MASQSLRAALDFAEPKPDPRAERGDKKNYAQRLSNSLAITVANGLRGRFKNVTPTATGKWQESRVGVDKGQKRLDVKVTDPDLGLILCVSIKTYSFQDYNTSTNQLGRWTKNIVRNDHELRTEASLLHRRQPYSVLVGVMFEPYETCDDGDPEARNDTGKSSFAHHVTTLAKRTGRGKRPVYGAGPRAYVDYGPDDPRFELFERVFIGLYATEGDSRGDVRFFDVEDAPPRHGRPSREQTISFEEFVDQVIAEVDRRNKVSPKWSNIDVAEG